MTALDYSGKKILHIIGDSKFGGDAVYMVELGCMLKEKGAKVYVLTTTSETQDLCSEHGLEVIDSVKIQRDISLFKDISALIKTTSLINKYKFDMVHTHTSKGGAIGRIAARLADCKAIIHTVHGFSFHQYSSKLELFVYKNIERLASRFCDKIISVNSEDRDYAISNNIASPIKITTIYNGVSPSRSRSQDRVTLPLLANISPECIVVGTLSRFSYQKDPLSFLASAINVLKQGYNVKFIYAGDGPMLEECKDFVRDSEFRDHILFPGFVSQSHSILSRLDVFVTTSLYEGLPIALLEAMQAGKAIVATNVKGNRECVNSKNSILVEAGNVPEISEAIITLIEDKFLRDSFGAAAREVFNEQFTIDTMKSNTLKLYDSLVIENAD